MRNPNPYKRNRHACYLLKYHLVVVTKYRHSVLNDFISQRLKEIVQFIFKEKWNCTVLSVETNGDHIHILFEAPPQVQLSAMVNNFKTVSARLLRKEYAEYLAQYYWKPVLWSRSYYIGSVSDTTEEVVKYYIEHQKTNENE